MRFFLSLFAISVALSAQESSQEVPTMQPLSNGDIGIYALALGPVPGTPYANTQLADACGLMVGVSTTNPATVSFVVQATLLTSDGQTRQYMTGLPVATVKYMPYSVAWISTGPLRVLKILNLTIIPVARDGARTFGAVN